MKAQTYAHGNTSIHLAYSPISQAWQVWREDSGYQALVRVFNEAWEAQEDYDNRVSFHKQVVQA